MIVEALKKLVRQIDLSPDEIKTVMREILEEKATPAQVAAFLTALRTKGETIDEISSCVEVLKEKGVTLNLAQKDVIDIVGTGGDGTNTFNISTATAFVVAGGGVKVAKHGSRASSSKSGAADVLEAVGANIMLSAKQNEEMLQKTGICFMFAPKFNPLFKNMAKVRQEIGIRTVVNCLGPLINPSCAKMQLVGVYDKNLVETAANVMNNLKLPLGMVVFGEHGLDEASVISKTYFAKIENGVVQQGEFSPEDAGIKRAVLDDLKGGTPKENAKIMQGLFNNEIKGAKKDAVALNAALGFLVSKKVKTIKEGIDLAYSIIDNGTALDTLNRFIKESNEYLK